MGASLTLGEAPKESKVQETDRSEMPPPGTGEGAPQPPGTGVVGEPEPAESPQEEPSEGSGAESVPEPAASEVPQGFVQRGRGGKP